MIINTHIHTFRGIEDVPEKFLPLGFIRLLAKKNWCNLVGKILHSLNPFSDQDSFDRYVNFIETGKLGSQKAIFENCFEQYPLDTKFVILPMDMEFMGCGKVPRNYVEQLRELRNLRAVYPENVIPFIHVDPRRNEYFEIFKMTVEQWGFRGLKLYPPLGIFPYDERFDCVYKYCEENNLPVIAHCTDGNPVHFKGKRKELVSLLQGCILDIDWNKTNKELCGYFTNPLGYEPVLKMFPKLKISLAHFGRGTEWDGIIKGMIEEYSNLYVDISYSMSDESLWPPLKILLITNSIFRERCLFGSDFYMNTIECTEKQFDIKFRCFIGEDLWRQISFTNPSKFLNI